MITTVDARELGIDRPVLMLDKQRCLRNIRRMADKASKQGLSLRPHFKTHQSLELGRWFRDCGCERITVSSLPMAEYFAGDGWSDITVAFPYNLGQASQVAALARRIDLKLLVSSPVGAADLAASITTGVEVFIELDVGHGRTGIAWDDYAGQQRALDTLAAKPSITFLGFLTHAGHSYRYSVGQLPGLNSEVLARLATVRQRWQPQWPQLLISSGDTPCSTVCDDFAGIDEIRPGNYAFFDMQQASHEVCKPSDIAVALIAPVVAVYPQRQAAAIWGGAVHLSKDLYSDSEGHTVYGALCPLAADGSWGEPLKDLRLSALSQEHGMISADKPEALDGLREGQLLAVLPAHSCLTADLMGSYCLPDGTWLDMLTSTKPR